jgi:hypothetical protein
MYYVVEYLLWPIVFVLQAICGVLGRTRTRQKAMYQKIARFTLLAGIAVLVMTFPLSLLANSVISFRPPLAVGVTLLLLFILFGNLADDPTEDEL